MLKTDAQKKKHITLLSNYQKKDCTPLISLCRVTHKSVLICS